MIKQKIFILIIVIVAFSIFGKTAHTPSPAPEPSLTPAVIPFNETVHSAFTLPLPCRVGIEEVVSSFESRFAIVTFSGPTIIGIDTVSAEEYKGGTRNVLGSEDGNNLVLLSAGQLAVLDRPENRVSVEYTTVPPRSDFQTQYFQGKITGSDRLLVIAEMQPSVGEEGVVDATLHSLVYEDVRARKTLSKIVLEHPLNEQPPVFFSKDVIIYRNKRKDISEPWKALDNTLSPASHPLCALLDRELRQFLVWGLVMSDQHKHAVVYSIDAKTKMPAIMYVSWQTNKVSNIDMPAGMFLGQKNLMMSPSGKWVFFTATIDNENKRSLNHMLLYLDPALSNGYLPPRIIALGKNEDRVAWVSEPEGLVIFSKGQVSLWDLPKFDIKKPKPKTRKR
jgi:hypothetical protein